MKAIKQNIGHQTEKTFLNLTLSAHQLLFGNNKCADCYSLFLFTIQR